MATAAVCLTSRMLERVTAMLQAMTEENLRVRPTGMGEEWGAWRQLVRMSVDQQTTTKRLRSTNDVLLVERSLV